MTTARAALAFAFSLGAGCAPATAPRAPVAPSVPPAVLRAPPPVTSEEGPSSHARSCEGRAPEVFSFAAGADLTCADRHRDCHSTLAIEILNCTAASVVIDPIAVIRHEARSDVLSEYVPGSPIAAGASFAFSPSVSSAGAYEIAVVVLEADRAERLPPIEIEIGNPALTRALAACTACNGRWGREGMMGLDGCNCRPTDAGKICHDGDECEGACLPDGVEVITRPRPLTCDRRGNCSVAIGTGRLVGHCSDRMTIFGCHAEIARGASKQPPAWLPIHVASICVD